MARSAAVRGRFPKPFVRHVLLDPADKATRVVVQVLKQAIVRIAAVEDIKPAGLDEAPQLGPLRAGAGGHRNGEGIGLEHPESHRQLRRPVPVILPQRPSHAGQRRQQAPVDGNQGQ